MSEFLFDYWGNKIFFDLKSTVLSIDQRIDYPIGHIQGRCPEYYVRFHRENGPAVILTDGTEIFCKHGKSHNIDGPATIRADGIIVWCLDGDGYSFEEWCKILNKSHEEINFLKLKYNV